MSEIEIPKEYREAWRWLMHARDYLHGAVNADMMQRAADALVWALAGWMRSEFEREHGLKRSMDGNYLPLCNRCGRESNFDPRHAWTDDQWLAAARARLGEG